MTSGRQSVDTHGVVIFFLHFNFTIEFCNISDNRDRIGCHETNIELLKCLYMGTNKQTNKYAE